MSGHSWVLIWAISLFLGLFAGFFGIWIRSDIVLWAGYALLGVAGCVSLAAIIGAVADLIGLGRQGN